MSEVKPPAHLSVYVEALGVQGTIQFLLRFGGGQLMIGHKPNAANPVAKEMGLEAAQALAAVRDRLPAQIPVGKKWIAQVKRAEGLPVTEIARMLHTTEPTVRRYLAKATSNGRPADKQLPLFPTP